MTGLLLLASIFGADGYLASSPNRMDVYQVWLNDTSYVFRVVTSRGRANQGYSTDPMKTAADNGVAGQGTTFAHYMLQLPTGQWVRDGCTAPWLSYNLLLSVERHGLHIYCIRSKSIEEWTEGKLKEVFRFDDKRMEIESAHGFTRYNDSKPFKIVSGKRDAAEYFEGVLTYDFDKESWRFIPYTGPDRRSCQVVQNSYPVKVLYFWNSGREFQKVKFDVRQEEFVDVE